MNWAYVFADPANVIVLDANDPPHKSFEETMQRICDLNSVADRFLAKYPAVREAYDRAKVESEAAWQRAHLEVFERYFRLMGTEPLDV